MSYSSRSTTNPVYRRTTIAQTRLAQSGCSFCQILAQTLIMLGCLGVLVNVVVTRFPSKENPIQSSSHVNGFICWTRRNGESFVNKTMMTKELNQANGQWSCEYPLKEYSQAAPRVLTAIEALTNQTLFWHFVIYSVFLAVALTIHDFALASGWTIFYPRPFPRDIPYGIKTRWCPYSLVPELYSEMDGEIVTHFCCRGIKFCPCCWAWWDRSCQVEKSCCLYSLNFVLLPFKVFPCFMLGGPVVALYLSSVISACASGVIGVIGVLLVAYGFLIEQPKWVQKDPQTFCGCEYEADIWRSVAICVLGLLTVYLVWRMFSVWWAEEYLTELRLYTNPSLPASVVHQLEPNNASPTLFSYVDARVLPTRYDAPKLEKDYRRRITSFRLHHTCSTFSIITAWFLQTALPWVAQKYSHNMEYKIPFIFWPVYASALALVGSILLSIPICLVYQHPEVDFEILPCWKFLHQFDRCVRNVLCCCGCPCICDEDCVEDSKCAKLYTVSCCGPEMLQCVRNYSNARVKHGKYGRFGYESGDDEYSVALSVSGSGSLNA